MFSITETDDPVVFSLPSLGPGDEIPDYDGVRFNAEKWCFRWELTISGLHRRQHRRSLGELYCGQRGHFVRSGGAGRSAGPPVSACFREPEQSP